MYSKKVLSDNWLKQSTTYYQATNIKPCVQIKAYETFFKAVSFSDSYYNKLQ